MAENEKQPIKLIYKWLIAIAGVITIFSGLFLYIRDDQKRDDEIEHRLLESPAMKAAVETHMNGVNEVANFKASLDLTKVGEDWVRAADTLVATYNFVYDVLDTYRLQNQALLKMVHNMDSINAENNARMKRMEISLKNNSNAFIAIQGDIEDINTDIKRLKLIELQTGD